MGKLEDLGEGVFRLSGAICLMQVPALWNNLRRIFPALKTDDIKIQVDDITQIDSGGVAFLVSWARWANFCGKRLHLTGSNQKLNELIESNKLQKLFVLEPR